MTIKQQLKIAKGSEAVFGDYFSIDHHKHYLLILKNDRAYYNHEFTEESFNTHWGGWSLNGTRAGVPIHFERNIFKVVWEDA